ncbi:MAG: hypothetical protein KME17_05990 [Cyanosarcina radialis HA8281-LM2]|jgi:hypothetical protein|nr:hypothetical protein [Cyanosarcina radialis HA8281-LM2]
MADATSTKYLLDSSVVRPMLLGTQAYQRYFESQFGSNPRYISPYVQMEMKRSYLRNIINFYFTLRLPTIPTIGDALTFWSNYFQGSKHKAVEQLVAQLLSTQALDFTRPEAKEIALRVLEGLIAQFVESLEQQFLQIDRDSTKCARASVLFQIDTPNAATELKRFIDRFDDLETCRRQCQIDRFLLEDHRDRVEQYIDRATRLPKNDNTRGFIGIVNNLKEIVERGATACSCKRCERIGDAVIALDAPRDMQLEHTDNSFDYLCYSIDQPHRKHPSETQIILGYA